MRLTYKIPCNMESDALTLFLGQCSIFTVTYIQTQKTLLIQEEIHITFEKDHLDFFLTCCANLNIVPDNLTFDPS